jgi:hypothetical protein
VNPDEAAFTIVMALHHGHNDTAAQILCALDAGETASVVVCLALALDVAWMEQCETDGVPFDEFAHHAGAFLAERSL